MTKPSKITSANIRQLAVRYKHFVWTALVPLFITFFALAESTVVTGYWVSYTRLDDFIPFVPEFAFFYFLWYPLLFFTGLYLLLRDADGFRRYMWALMSSFFITLLFCVLVPNGQDLRPAELAGKTVFTGAISWLYTIDTNTNVMPSMHVIGSIIATFAVFHSPGLRKTWLRVLVVTATVMINASTVLIKQHSILDIYGGIAYCVPVYIVFYVIIKRRQEKKRAASDIEAGDAGAAS